MGEAGAGHALAQATFLKERSFQVAKLLDLLDQANRGSGSRKPVLSVGRDGITLREYRHRLYEVASCATVTVIDRTGKRLGTMYLARVPEHGQGRMSDQLTALIEALCASLDGDGKPTATTVKSVSDIVSALAQGVRGASRVGEKM